MFLEGKNMKGATSRPPTKSCPQHQHPRPVLPAPHSLYQEFGGTFTKFKAIPSPEPLPVPQNQLIALCHPPMSQLSIARGSEDLVARHKAPCHHTAAQIQPSSYHHKAYSLECSVKFLMNTKTSTAGAANFHVRA